MYNNLEICGAESLHVKPGKGAAFVRTKLKHQISGNSSDKTFRAGETVATADIAKQESQYTYADGNEVGCTSELSIVSSVLTHFASLLRQCAWCCTASAPFTSVDTKHTNRK